MTDEIKDAMRVLGIPQRYVLSEAKLIGLMVLELDGLAEGDWELSGPRWTQGVYNAVAVQRTPRLLVNKDGVSLLAVLTAAVRAAKEGK